MKVNEDELRALSGWYVPAGCGGGGAMRTAARSLMRTFGLHEMLVTLGARGYAYFGPDGPIVRDGGGPALPVVVDTVGAGDAFSALFLLGRALGWPVAPIRGRHLRHSGRGERRGRFLPAVGGPMGAVGRRRITELHFFSAVPLR
ncbi:PfkB family carbohydrate kinase [Massilia glaciei]|uniref:PfkB family carbohydrate kinase n=1 Tax=Massilia glaciei TaxID=1524097 RepID=UPI001E646EDC|nr:PfkB family carbohydrate kinase [Massilia glaciei]